MNEIRTLKVPSTVSEINLRGQVIEIPKFCPRCGAVNNPVLHTDGYRSFSDGSIAYITCQCLACNSWSFITIQAVSSDLSDSWKLLSKYPDNSSKTFDTLLMECSPRFVDSYNAAFDAEQNGHYDLAGMGYRASLEILIKDWAVKYTSEDTNKIAKYKLNDAISHFLKDDTASFASSDVVRDLGNESTHWDRPDNFDPEQNLKTVKTYLDIFINEILLKLRISNPPAGRAHHSDSNSK